MRESRDASEDIAVARIEAADLADQIGNGPDIYERVAEWHREVVGALESDEVAITKTELL